MTELTSLTLGDYERRGDFELGRGEVISTGDLDTYPGNYPVYSSSAVDDGVFGRYERYMFDEELITWSIDGGGRPFHRRKHRFSVTNVCGFLRINRPDRWDYGYLHAILEKLQSGIQFDYQMKAHPSVIRDLYQFKCIPIEEQRAIGALRENVDTNIRQTEQIIEKLKQVKQGLLHDLLTRGIDPNGELRPPQDQAPHLYKDSPLGWIPRDWEAAGLIDMAPSDRSVLKTGPFGSSLKGEHFTVSGRPVVTIGSLGEGRFLTDELLYVSEKTAQVLADFELRPGDIAFSRVADVGRSVVVGEAERGWIMSSNFMRISVDSSFVAPEFLQALLAADVRVKKQIRSTVNSAGRDVASSAILMSLRFPAPPYSEQAQIIGRMTVIDQRVEAEERLLKKLRSERVGLMDDLLTGRVRVTPLLA